VVVGGVRCLEEKMAWPSPLHFRLGPLVLCGDGERSARTVWANSPEAVNLSSREELWVAHEILDHRHGESVT
jgi:hypothetical protein